MILWFRSRVVNTMILVTALCACAVTIGATPVRRTTIETGYWRDAAWRTSSPEAQGMEFDRANATLHVEERSREANFTVPATTARYSPR